MANDEMLTDDYVAELLAKDAKESSIKYSSLGLEAFTKSKPPANKPKPNTRFLRNIIKDTDSHNAALLAKEAAEARARLRDLGGSENRKEKASRVGRAGGGDIRRRQLGDIAAILGGRPRKRARIGKEGRRVNTSSEDEAPEEPKTETRKGRDRRQDREESGRSGSHRSHHRRHRSTSDDGEDRPRRHKSRSRSPRKHECKESRHRNRSRSPRERGSKESRHRERSPIRKRSRSSETEKSRKSHRSNRDQDESNTKNRDREKHYQETKRKPDYDSDPLDDIIGPRPPPIPQVRTKGRGTISKESGIDARFSVDYDPTTDVQLDPDEEQDWDQALEAFRDRQKWKQQGADRLRAAGFTEDEIKKWEGGGEKREEDVKWAKKGEGREWDRGKVLDDDGVISIEPQFGRLKDT